jgi:ATP-dependent RNA helicase DDX3X
MSDWGVPELKEALPASQPEEAGEIAADEAASTGQTPQAAGWVQPTAFDYGITEGDWASNAAVYEWEEEFGDVGPAFPELEAVLFGSETRMTQGVDFQR